MKNLIGKIKVLSFVLLVICLLPLSVMNSFAEEVIQEDPYTPDPAQEESYPVETVPIETEPIETEPIETQPIETEPIETQPIETEPVETQPIETEQVETEPVETQPIETEPGEAGIIETPTYDINQLPTLVDSTQVAEDLPKAIGADANSGGVSYVGGIVCWIAVGISVAVIFAFLISTKGKNKAGIGRYESGNKLGGTHYNDNIRYR